MRTRGLTVPVVLTALLVVVLALAGCSDAAPGSSSGSSEPSSETGSATASPSPSPADPPTDPPADGPAYSTWPLGEQVLALRPDGYGESRPTPPSLRVRRYRTTDLLPAPPRNRFVSTLGPITGAVRARMGETWRPGCPVPLADLRYVTVSFRGFDGAAHTGELVVAADQAEAVVSVFRALYAADFAIEEMRLPTTADLEAAPTGDGNNTAALVCRATTASTGFSAHAYGLALDLNPFQNPYLKDDLVLPELASSYLDRGWRRPGMVSAGNLAVREFARIGWSWGGDFTSLKDYQHFTATGR